MGALEANATVAAAVALAGVALALTVVGAVSYLRTRQGRLAWVTVAMAGMFAQGVVHTRHAVQDRGLIASGAHGFPLLLALDAVVVAALYLAVLKR